MGIVDEFKEFAMRGNVIDLAVGVIMGAAFAPIVASLVDNVVHAPDWLFDGRHRLLQSRGFNSDTDQSGFDQVRNFPQCRDQVYHHRVCNLPTRQGGQHDEEAESGGSGSPASDLRRKNI